jgi:hypothetical protein
MNRWTRRLLLPVVLVAGLMFVLPQSAEAGWGYRHGGYAYYGPSVSFYGGYYAPYRVYPPIVAPAGAFGYYTPYPPTPYSAYYYGYYPYARSFYYGPGMYWFGAYGW